jgi:hypothetical protein
MAESKYAAHRLGIEFLLQYKRTRLLNLDDPARQPLLNGFSATTLVHF